VPLLQAVFSHGCALGILPTATPIETRIADPGPWKTLLKSSRAVALPAQVQRRFALLDHGAVRFTARGDAQPVAVPVVVRRLELAAVHPGAEADDFDVGFGPVRLGLIAVRAGR
jgi:hypothetical protein